MTEAEIFAECAAALSALDKSKREASILSHHSELLDSRSTFMRSWAASRINVATPYAARLMRARGSGDRGSLIMELLRHQERMQDPRSS